MKTIIAIAILAGANAVQLQRTASETEMSDPNHPSLTWMGDFLLDNGRRPTQLAPHGGIVPIRYTSDSYPQYFDQQLYKPLTSEN